GTGAFLPAGLSLPGPVPANASTTGTTGVFINGREITTAERTYLENLIGSPILGSPAMPRTYYVLPNGDAGVLTGMMRGPVLLNLVQLATQHSQHPRHSVFSPYDLTGISVIGDGSFVGILYGS